METEQNTKSKIVAALLAFFLGSTGAHCYYLGYKKQGTIQTCGFVSYMIAGGIFGIAVGVENVYVLIAAVPFLIFAAVTSIWAFVDFIRILTGGLTPADGSFNLNQPHSSVVRKGQSYYMDSFEAIEKAGQLHEQDILTDEEFGQVKNKLLARF